MKIIYILPNNTVKSGGNWITVTRLSTGLIKRGISVDILEVSKVTRELLENYDVIHVFHVFKSLQKISGWLSDINKTVVVSFTGTDLKQLVELKKQKKAMIDLLNSTDKVIVFHDEARGELIMEGLYPDKVKVIPQAPVPMEIPEIKQMQRNLNTDIEKEITFLFAAGIRSVKAPLEVIEMISGVVDALEKTQNARLVIVGPILDKDVGEKFKEKIKNKKWVQYLGEAPHQAVQALISASDIVINASFSEGMPNTLLEARQLGRPILARNIAGNRSIVTHGENGFLFENSEEFKYYAIKLIQDPALRKSMGSAGLKVSKNYSLDQEVAEYERIYRA